MDDQQLAAKEFHLKEFDALRKEISDAEARFFSIIQYVLTISGAIYAFLLGIGKFGGLNAKLPSTAFNIVAFVPAVTSAVGFAANVAIGLYLVSIGKYLSELEAVYAVSGLGWERFPKKGWAILIVMGIGILILVLNLIAGVWLVCQNITS
ncbi:MAG: hypothetical protein AB7H90_05125 [Alphaproteobacteria bacterium]